MTEYTINSNENCYEAKIIHTMEIKTTSESLIKNIKEYILRDDMIGDPDEHFDPLNFSRRRCIMTSEDEVAF